MFICVPSRRGHPSSQSRQELAADDIAYLDDMLRDGASPSAIAEHLRRDVLEIISKIAERRR